MKSICVLKTSFLLLSFVFVSTLQGQDLDLARYEFNDTLYWIGEPTLDESDNTPYRTYYRYDSAGKLLSMSQKFPRDGRWISFFKDQPNKVAGTFMVNDSMLTGVSITYYLNGQRESFYELYQGEAAGVVRYWNEEGVLVDERRFEFDSISWPPGTIQAGEWRKWDDSGNLLMIEHYEANEQHGSQVYFFPNGQLRLQSQYFYGVPDGTEIEYHSNGALRETRIFEKGIRITDSITYQFHPNNAVSAKGPRLDENKIDRWTYYYPDGVLKSQGDYCLKPFYSYHGPAFISTEIGEWKYWYSNGTLKAVLNYSVNDTIIEQSYYDREGQEIDKEKFDQLGESLRND